MNLEEMDKFIRKNTLREEYYLENHRLYNILRQI